MIPIYHVAEHLKSPGKTFCERSMVNMVQFVCSWSMKNVGNKIKTTHVYFRCKLVHKILDYLRQYKRQYIIIYCQNNKSFLQQRFFNSKFCKVVMTVLPNVLDIKIIIYSMCANILRGTEQKRNLFKRPS